MENGHRVKSKSRRGIHTSFSRSKQLTVKGNIVTSTEMSKNHHHQKHKQGANQNENKTEDGKTIRPIDPTTDIGKSIEPKLTSCIIESFDGETVDERCGL